LATCESPAKSRPFWMRSIEQSGAKILSARRTAQQDRGLDPCRMMGSRDGNAHRPWRRAGVERGR
jgi:hypothetical protein